MEYLEYDHEKIGTLIDKQNVTVGGSSDRDHNCKFDWNFQISGEEKGVLEMNGHYVSRIFKLF